jgi:hypothetical protein
VVLLGLCTVGRIMQSECTRTPSKYGEGHFLSQPASKLKE